jgi:hypothetical protein
VKAFRLKVIGVTLRDNAFDVPEYFDMQSSYTSNVMDANCFLKNTSQ